MDDMCSPFQVKMERIEEERQGEGEARRLQQDEEEMAEKVGGSGRSLRFKISVMVGFRSGTMTTHWVTSPCPRQKHNPCAGCITFWKRYITSEV